MANNFIDNGTVSTTGNALPSTKSNVPLAPALPSSQSLSANDVNTITGALADVKTVVTRTVSIMSYGADPTGATDSSAAFAAAFTSLAAGGTLYLPTGTYKIAAAVTGVGLIVQGDGIGATILNLSGSGQLILSGSYARLIGCTITSSNTPTVPSVSLADNTFNSRIRDCLFTGCAAGALASSGLLINTEVRDCVFTGCCIGVTTPVIALGNGSSTTTVLRGCYVSNNNDTATGVAVALGAGDPARIHDCWIESSGNALILGTTGAIITSCYFEYMVGTSGCIVHDYTFNVGSFVLRDCFFSMYAPWAINTPIITTNAQSVVLQGNYFDTNPYEFASANGITLLSSQAALLDRIVMTGNSSNDPGLFSQMNGDSDQVFGSADSYTNMTTHSSFEDTSHVTVVGAVATATQAMSGYLGGTSQQLAFNGGGSGYCEFTNAVDSGTTVGDTYTVSFYAKVSAGSDVNPASPLYLSMLDTVNSVFEGFYALAPTSTWKRFVFKTLPAQHTASHVFVILPPTLSTPPTVTVLIDGLQIEKNTRRPHPLATTTSAAVTVGIVNTNAT